MKKFSSRILLSSVSVLSLALNGLYACDEEVPPVEQQTEEGNAGFNVRPLLPEESAYMHESRALEQEDGEVRALPVSTETEEGSAPIVQLVNRSIKSRKAATQQEPPVQILQVSGSYVTIDEHWIDSFPQSNIIRLEDGSEWAVPASDMNQIYYWGAGHRVVISPNKSFFASSEYYLTNRTLNTYVRIAPYKGPTIYDPYTQTIGQYTQVVVGFNRSMNQVSLSNGQGVASSWYVAPEDKYLFDKWQMNDPVILGVNDRWCTWFNSYDHILINVYSNHYVRVRQF